MERNDNSTLSLSGERNSPRPTAGIGDRKVPAVPIKCPIDIRWCCHHAWTPHVHPDGSISHLNYDCVRCGGECEHPSPSDGPWPRRKWLAERIFPYGRTIRRNRKAYS